MGLQRKTQLTRTGPLTRTPFKSSKPSKKPRKDWALARAKVDAEGRCRVCGSTENLQAAHLIGQAKQDHEVDGKIIVQPHSILPLCEPHHRAYDAHCLDLLAYTTLVEQVAAVEAAGGIYLANRRLSGGRNA